MQGFSIMIILVFRAVNHYKAKSNQYLVLLSSASKLGKLSYGYNFIR